MVTVRFFAAAAEAAGAEQATVPEGTVEDIRARLIASRGDDLARVWRQCAVMVDGRRVAADELVAAGSTLDVLPPFAGG
ncbi:MoaD/ThiS family protein [Demequina aurantiaca]|uniref:MoaD/ThiS family protein n=1 Tax=Demequina aurantiaca TaxID=676200 RepID=UPI000786144B|nr:MoaD/ThiS family protein [Demequina aurantiaca]